MRNIFDQYHSPENKLSHALATTLAVDQSLCRSFLAWLTGRRVSARTRLVIDQQTVPGSPPEQSAVSDENKGLPDICIHSEDDWCVVIESKVAAGLTANQLQRHRRTVSRNFEQVTVVALTADPKPSGLIEGVIHLTWRDVYQWMGAHADKAPFWCRHLREYMRSFESHQLAEGYRMLGPITTFDGIPFGPGHLYSYLEAKLLLRQAIALLRERPRVKALGVDQKFPGRKSITGKDGTAVWDLLSLRPADSSDNFTTWPHLTLGIHADKTNPMITVPNGIKGSCRQAIKNLGTDGFIDLCMEVVNEARHNFGKQSGYIPVLRVVQRHYLGQRRAVIDGDTHVDLRITTGDAKGGIKRQTHWLTAAHQIATDRQGANVQLQFGVWFPHEDGLLRKINPLEGIESAWESCKPVLDVLMGRR